MEDVSTTEALVQAGEAVGEQIHTFEEQIDDLAALGIANRELFEENTKRLIQIASQVDEILTLLNQVLPK